MTNIFRIIFLLALISPVAACGVKGKVKSPAQIEKEEAKKAAAKAKSDKEKAEDAAEQPAPVAETK